MPLPAVTADGVRREPSYLNFGPSVALAATGSVIANAAAITGRFTVVSGADNAKGVILPSGTQIGDAYLVYSSVASSGLLVYPPVNGTIDDGSANASVAVEGRSLQMFVNANGVNWVRMGLLNA